MIGAIIGVVLIIGAFAATVLAAILYKRNKRRQESLKQSDKRQSSSFDSYEI